MHFTSTISTLTSDACFRLHDYVINGRLKVYLGQQYSSTVVSTARIRFWNTNGECCSEYYKQQQYIYTCTDIEISIFLYMYTLYIIYHRSFCKLSIIDAFVRSKSMDHYLWKYVIGQNSKPVLIDQLWTRMYAYHKRR